jgi:uncharacterized repeat protein (TIGR01451 family)
MRRLAGVACIGLLSVAGSPARVSAEPQGQQAPGAESPIMAEAIRAPRQQPLAEDFGEGYRYDGRFVPLHRSLTEIALTFGPESTEEGRRTTSAALGAAEVVEETRVRDTTIARVRVPAIVGQARMADPSERQEAGGRLKQVLVDAGRLPGVRYARPVYINPETGGRLLLTDEVVVKLGAGKTLSAVAGVFSAEGLSVVERVAGQEDQLVLRIDDPSTRDALQVAAKLLSSGAFAWAEPNFAQEIRYEAVPNDTLFPNQWHLNNTGQKGALPDADVDANEAWDVTTGDPAITIAIVDDGVQRDHPDLMDNIFINPGEVAGNGGVDDDGNGYIDDVSGWDFADGDNSPDPGSAANNHGTAVAGVAAARGGNALGVAGACQSCQILPVRLPTGSVLLTTLRDAIIYAGRLADVVNGSWTLSAPSSTVRSGIQWATTNGRSGKGAPVLFASGNSATGLRLYSLSGIPAGTHHFVWSYSKDLSGSAGDDTAWIAWIVFPDFTRVDFEGGLPADFVTDGDALWTVQDDAAHADTGAGFTHVAKAGTIGNTWETTVLHTVRTVAVGGTVYFYAWVSSEAGHDGLWLGIDYNDDGSWDAEVPEISGVPAVTRWVGFPASAPESIAVGASSDLDYRSAYSQYGSNLDFLAPSNSGPLNGNAITTTDRTGADGYDTTSDYTASFGGTSSATPLAAGVAGLILSANPGRTQAQVRELLRNTADKVGPGGYLYGRSNTYGYGRINANAAVRSTNPILTVTTTGTGAGTVRSNGTLIDCPSDCGEIYPVGTPVTLVADPDARSQFVGWSGGGCSGTGNCNVTLNADTNVSAEFRDAYRQLSVRVDSAGGATGTVRIEPPGADCSVTADSSVECVNTYDIGSPVTLTATPDAAWRFVGWGGGDCTGTDPCTLTLTSDVMVFAAFGPSTVQLSVDPFPLDATAMGHVNVTPGPYTCEQPAPGLAGHCVYSYLEDTAVVLTAEAAPGSRFVGWTGACVGTVGPTCTLTITADVIVGADFQGLAELSLQKTDSADPVGVGNSLTYTLTVTNAGPLAADNVTVVDTLPDTLTFVSATSPECSRVGQTVTCVAASIDAGSSATFTIETTVSAGAIPSVINTATVTADQADTDPADNTASQTTTVVGHEVTFLTATARAAEIELEWLNPVVGPFVRTVIRYDSAATFATCTPPASVGDGTWLADVGGALGSHQTALHASGLVESLTYCYSAFVDMGGTYSAGRTVSARLVPAGGPVVWGYSARTVAIAPLAVGYAVNAVSNDNVLHAIARGEAGGDWPVGWTPFAMEEPAQHRPTSVPLAYGAATRQIILNSQDGHVYGVDASTGQPLWQSDDFGTLQAGTAAWLTSFGATRNLLLIGSRNAGVDNVFYALDPADRSIVWSFGAGEELGPVDAMAAVDYALGSVYFTSEERRAGAGTVWCLDLSTGAKKWSVALGSITAAPVYRNGRVYVATASAVHAIDAMSGGPPLWSFPTLDGAVKWSVNTDRLTDDLYFSTNTKVWSLSDPGSPSLNWSTDAIPNPSAPMYVTGENRLYVGSSDGHLWQLDTLLMASEPPPPEALRNVMLGDGTATVGPPIRDTASGLVHVGTEAGVIYAVRQPFGP